MMTNDRSAIPVGLRRRVLVEAGHRCAIHTCRSINVDVHHIVPWKECKEHKYENLIVLCPNCHRLAEKGEIDRESLRMYKANLRYAIDKFTRFEVDLLFELYRKPANYGELFLKSMRLLIIRLLDAGYVRICEHKGPTYNAIEAYLIPDTLLITEEGRKFIDSLGFEHDW